jgi:hypothetical protein
VDTATTTNSSALQRRGSGSGEKMFGDCLLIKYDNHYLVEWLAYHYHVLPLRHLIVGVDPSSRTSPTQILDRYRDRGLIKISEVTDSDFWPKAEFEELSLLDDGSTPKAQVDRYLARQKGYFNDID